MVESLKELSDRATPGEAYADMDEFKLIAHPPGSTYIPDRTLVALCACGPNAWANVHFLAALWTAFRRGQLHDATALAEARAEGRRQGLEEAAKAAAPDDRDLCTCKIGQCHFLTTRCREVEPQK